MNKKVILISFVFLFILLIGIISLSITQPDTQCTKNHPTTTTKPHFLQTAQDYFDLGNYQYDSGDCKAALVSYTKAITLNPNYAQAYNNRAYTNMRLQNYKEALPDLDTAIGLYPNYVQARMNRGDIYNYYYAIDRKRAVTDYEAVIALGKTQNTSVCGHLFLAKHNGWNVGTILAIPTAIRDKCAL